MFANCNFYAWVPLSNWLRGYDRYGQVFDKSRLPRTRFPEWSLVLAHDAPAEHRALVLAKVRDLIDRLGVVGDRLVCLGCRLPTDPALGMSAAPNTQTGTGVGWSWPSPRLPVTAVAWVDEAGVCHPVPIEEVTAAAFALSDHRLLSWSQCRPRSFSVLPISRACNAACAFCFSRASVSEATLAAPLDLTSVRTWSSLARAQGAERAVITGGGEPTLLRPERMRELIHTLSADFDQILLITNASVLQATPKRPPSAIADLLGQWRTAGLTRVAVSRHGIDAVSDARIMGLAVDQAPILDQIHKAGLASRLICVLQSSGVQDASGVQAYLQRAAAEGVGQVCFKELYVSSLSENPWAPSAENQYCHQHQVPLSMLIAALRAQGFEQVDALPWGSPVFRGQVNGRPMQVAAYTEPSVGWERAHGVVRSWNWMSDGRCLASLEDPASVLVAPESPTGHNTPRPLAVELVD